MNPLTKTLSDGRTATITRHTPQPHDTIAISWDVSIDGTPYTSGNIHHRPKPDGKPGEVVKAIGTGKVLLLTDAEAAQLQAVLDVERQAAAPTPRSQRAELAAAVQAAYDQASSARADVQDNEAPWGPVTAAEGAATAAEEALEAFDAEHPDLVAELQAEEDKATERALHRAFTD
ncbi:hypothetical protein [Streptosporangium sp. NPDC002524]|uniref:hypothetical protein n=1 Tax=Streptosporangium sp. NPDC002524 TaxID=3154537 RepID=UPI003323CA0F